ncbi:homocysteine S-methyltransferase family protein [Prevotella veroralis]|uniref:homocysteine S-methyltransferase family protein n=1 Tax=Prevotella veroralis TaxID=28137 RepID=UPI003744460C
MSSQTLEVFLVSISSYPIFSVSLNYSFGAEQMHPYIKELAVTHLIILVSIPNAGLPNSMG